MTSTEISVDQDRLIQLAQSLIRIPSFTYQETEVARFLYSYLLGAGFEVELQEVPLKDRPASHQVVARWRGAKAGPKVLLCDTWIIQENYQPEGWRTDPLGSGFGGLAVWFGQFEHEGRVAAIVAAVEGLKQGGFDLHGEIVIAGVMGEIWRWCGDWAPVEAGTGLRLWPGDRAQQPGRGYHCGGHWPGATALVGRHALFQPPSQCD